MNGLENAQFDLSDAQFSLETAIELLSSINSDDNGEERQELSELINQLVTIKSELASSFSLLQHMQSTTEH